MKATHLYFISEYVHLTLHIPLAVNLHRVLVDLDLAHLWRRGWWWRGRWWGRNVDVDIYNKKFSVVKDLKRSFIRNVLMLWTTCLFMAGQYVSYLLCQLSIIQNLFLLGHEPENDIGQIAWMFLISLWTRSGPGDISNNVYFVFLSCLVLF